MIKGKKLGLAGRVFLSGLSLVGGCAHYSDSEKFWAGACLAAQIGDFATTEMGIDKGARELNPFLGESPSDVELALFKLGSFGVYYLLGEIFPESRKSIYQAGSFIGAGVSVWNYSEYKKMD